MTTSFTISKNVFVFGDDEFRFGILASGTQDEFFDESVEEVAETRNFMRAVDDVTFGVVVESSLSTKFTSKEFGRIYEAFGSDGYSTDFCPRGLGKRRQTGRGSVESPGDITHVGKNCTRECAVRFLLRKMPRGLRTGFDAVSFAFDFGHQNWHSEDRGTRVSAWSQEPPIDKRAYL